MHCVQRLAIRRLLLSVVLGACGAALAPAAASAALSAATSLKTVRYGTYSVRVPSRWPVFRLSSDPSACVRFNRHAVYLGRPSAAQRCPAHAVGRTEAILVEPLVPAAARFRGVPSPAFAASGAEAQQALEQLVVPSRRVVVTASWGRDPGTIERALGVRRLPSAPVGAARAPVGHLAGVRAPAAVPRRAHTFHAIDVGGYGFDTCSAPSAAAMSAWLQSSPFRAAAIYIGGANSACAQPNLSAAWVSGESAAGWQFIPVYVGLQSPTSSCGCAVIKASQATAEGDAAAVDAVAQAQALGIGTGNPIYYDMEGYNQTSGSTSAVLAFLSAWTSQLTAYHYISGVYSSAGSGITDMVNALGTTFVEPSDIWIADWNNQATASDPYVPAADWAANQRLHQYRGDHIDTYGGVRLDIDSDFLDGATATAGPGVGIVGAGILPDGTFVSYRGKTYRLAGGAPLYVHSWSVYGGPQPVVPLAAVQWKALNAVPANGTFIRATGTGKVYRIAGGAPVYVSNWTAFGAAQPTVIVDRWDILNISSPAAHLRSVPADGTVVEGLPSASYWMFSSGMRTVTAPSSAAVGVDDIGLSPLLEAPTPSRVILNGVAISRPKLRVTVTAGANAPALKAVLIKLPRGLRFVRSTKVLAAGVFTWGPTGRVLRSTLSLSRGTLTITLSRGARAVRITLYSSVMIATKALAAEVRGGYDVTLPVLVTATDIRQDTAVLSLDPRAT